MSEKGFWVEYALEIRMYFLAAGWTNDVEKEGEE